MCGEKVREQITSHDPLKENKMYNLAYGCVRTHKLTKSFLESKICVNRRPTTLAKDSRSSVCDSLPSSSFNLEAQNENLLHYRCLLRLLPSLILHCFVSSYSNHYATSKQIPRMFAVKKHFHPQAFFMYFLHSVLTAIPYSCTVENVANFLIELHHSQMVLTINPEGH